MIFDIAVITCYLNRIFRRRSCTQSTRNHDIGRYDMHGTLQNGDTGKPLFSKYAVLPLLNLVYFFLLLTGCAQTSHLKTTNAPVSIPPNAKILLMTPDIQLFELTAGGMQEPKADWTAAAKQHVRSALDKQLKRRNDVIVSYQAPVDKETEHAHLQLVKLHEMVGNTILVHKYNPALSLPTKKDKMDYSLGEGVGRLKEHQAADCALFIFMRDSYASAGRVAVIAAAAVLGVAVPGGFQLGFASLVDLETGDIIWFNRLARGYGDLRTPEPATEAVTQLLAEIPL